MFAMLAPFVLALALLVERTSNQEALIDDLAPKINFINIQSTNPTITITFKSPTLEFENPLTDFWVKIEMPFTTSSLGPPTWSSTTSCCDFSTMVFSPTIENHAGYSGNFSTIYVKLVGSTFSSSDIFVLQMIPKEWINTVGYTEYMKISIVSENHTSAIVYAYNNAFTNFYGSEVAKNNLLVSDATVDSNMLKVNKIIDSYLVVQVGYSTAQRIIIQTKGAYTFADDSNSTCGIVADATRGISAVDSSLYKCEFWENLGPSKKNYMVFTWTKSYIPSGKYKLKYRLNTPPSSGDHHLAIYTLARYYPYIFIKKDYDYIFAAINDQWESGYPKLYYSSNFDANNAQTIDQIGLYSMGLNYHKAFNSLRLVLRASTAVSPLNAGEYYSLDIYVGDKTAILPLGYVYENLPLASGFSQKNISYSKGILTIDYIGFAINTAYTVSFRVGFILEQALPTDNVQGFGLCILRKGTTALLQSSAKMRSRFNVVKFNPALMTVESVDRGDSFKRRHRGFSAFRSAPSSSLSSITNYNINTATNGLRIGTSSNNFWFQSSIGPNPLFYLQDLVSTHNGKRIFLDVITDKSISPSSSTVYTDSSASSNCDAYSRVYGKWASAIDKVSAQLAVNKQGAPIPIITSMTATDTANFIGGCNVRQFTVGGDTYTRFRMRFQDFLYQDANSVNNFVRAKDIVLIDKDEVKLTTGAQGNIFVWKNIEVNKYPSFKFVNTDAVVLDAFVLMYLYAGTETTTSTIEFAPEISSLDNMYVLASDETVFPITTNLYASIQHTWMYDSNTDPTKWDLTMHDSQTWPVVLHLYGTFNNLPSTTKYVMIFFDFLEIMITDELKGTVGCSIKGITATSCKYGLGHNKLTEQIYRTIENNAGYSYITSRLSSFLQLELSTSEAANFNKDFSIVIPVKHFTGQEISKLATLYENKISLGASLMAVDSTFQQLAFIDFGAGTKSFKIDTNVYDTSYQIPLTIENYEILSSAIRGLDDATANNNVNNALWIDPVPSSSFTIGSISDGKVKSICTTCTPFSLTTQLFSSGLFCGNWDIGSDLNFLVDYNAADDKIKPHKIQYLNNQSILRTCVYIPSLISSASITDANIKQYDIKKFFVPSYSGIKWPADFISVVSNSKVLGYMKPQSLNLQFLPNSITFGTGDDTINFIQEYNSAKVTLNFQISNPLPAGGVLFFGVTAGCEALLTIYGEVSTPPCQIRNDISKGDGTGTPMSCIYSISTGGFQVELQKALPINGGISMNNVEVIMYGLSIKKVSSSATCNYQLRSYLTLSKNPLLVIDKSTNMLAATFVTATDPTNPSGKLEILSSYSDNSQVTAYSNIQYRLNVTDRPIYQTDYVSVSLGALKYDTADEPVWCTIKDSTSGKYLPDFTRCVKDNLGLVGIKAYKDLSFTDFTVEISNIINPITTTPGAVAEYYINEGFVTFKSDLHPWSDIVNYGKFLNPVRVWTHFDVMGLKSDIFVSFIPDHTVNLTNVIYLYVSPAYIPTLSRFKVYVNLKYKSPASKTETAWIQMKIWNIASRMLAITGWPSAIPASSNITIQIIGVENPVTSSKRVFQVTLGYNKQYSLFKQWGYQSLGSASPLSPISLIRVESLAFDSLIIRENTKITIGFTFTRQIAAGSYILANIGYLGDEIVRKFKPFCFLTKSNEFIQSAERCYFIGNRLEAKLIYAIEKDVTYTFILDDIPNPDYGYVEPKSISLLAISNNRTEVFAISTDMIINYKKEQFVKRDLSQILDFVGLTDGEIEVPQGFYSTVAISPVVVDPLKESQFFLDQVSFALGDVESGSLLSKPLSILGITDFTAKVGTSGLNFIVGSSRTAVLTTYPVQVTKREATGKIYTELALLRVKVVPLTLSLLGVSSTDIYITSRSIPMKLYIDRVPTSDIKFDILFLNGNINGQVEVSSRQQQFSLSESKLAFFLQVEAFSSSIVPQSLVVTVRPVLESSNFLDKNITLNFIAKPASLPATVTSISVGGTSAFYYNFSYTAQSTSSVFIYYYAVPDYLYAAQSKDTVRAWALNGLSIIEGDIYVGSIGLITPNTLETTDLTILIADTTYKLTCFVEDPTTSDIEQKEFSFATKSLASSNAISTFSFSSPVSYENRIKILCIIARKFSLSYENLWSGDGLNCDPTLNPSYVTSYHSNNEAEPQSDSLKTQLLSMDIVAFQSKRKGENSLGLTNLIAATSLTGASNVFALYLNGVGRLSSLTPMGSFFETLPSLSTKTSVKEEWNKATITGIVFTGLKGFIYAVAQKETEFPDSLTTSELRKMTTFQSNYWAPVSESPSDITVVFNSLTPSTAYKAAILATSDNPRKGAVTSNIVYLTFNTPAKPASSMILSLISFFMLTSLIVFI